MRFPRFQSLLLDLLTQDGHPAIAKVEEVPTPGQETYLPELRVTCTDGTVFVLHTAHTAPPGGDDHTKPEKIVTKHNLAPSES